MKLKPVLRAIYAIQARNGSGLFYSTGVHGHDEYGIIQTVKLLRKINCCVLINFTSG